MCFGFALQLLGLWCSLSVALLLLVLLVQEADPRDEPLGDIFAGKSVIIIMGHLVVAIATVE